MHARNIIIRVSDDIAEPIDIQIEVLLKRNKFAFVSTSFVSFNVLMLWLNVSMLEPAPVSIIGRLINSLSCRVVRCWLKRSMFMSFISFFEWSYMFSSKTVAALANFSDMF